MPGYAASHGCVRLPRGFARKLFKATRLRTHVVVASGRDPRSMVDRALAELGLERRVAMTVPSYLSMLPALLRSELVGTLPSKLFVAGGPALEFREPPVALPDIELTLAWHARLDADPRQVWLRESLRQYVRDTFGESN